MYQLQIRSVLGNTVKRKFSLSRIMPKIFAFFGLQQLAKDRVANQRLKSPNKSQSSQVNFAQHMLGFTLIEVMVSTLVLASISTVAMASYSNYAHTALADQTVRNFESAVKYAKHNYATAAQRKPLGLSTDGFIMQDSDSWVEALNQQNEHAPGGGSAYAVGSGTANTGAIGVVFNPTTDAGGTSITVSQPSYAGLEARSITIYQRSY